MALLRAVSLFAICATVVACWGQQVPPTTPQNSSTSNKEISDQLSKLDSTELQRKASAGDGLAQLELAYRYSFGNGGLEKDKGKSAEWLRKAAAAGVPMAYFNLGVAYYNGDGLPTDDKQSCKWFKLASNAGVEPAREAVQRAKETLSAARFRDCELQVANAYCEGKEITRDYSRAIGLYKVLAAEGYGEASERLAAMYDRGWGVPSDPKQSVFWLERGADQGSSLAQYELGRLYELAIHVPQDYSRALKLYHASANGLFTPALMALSKMYMDGRGVKANPQTAFMWALLAADRGNPEAKSLASSIGAQLSKKQIEAAKKEALLHKAGQVKLTYTP